MLFDLHILRILVHIQWIFVCILFFIFCTSCILLISCILFCILFETSFYIFCISWLIITYSSYFTFSREKIFAQGVSFLETQLLLLGSDDGAQLFNYHHLHPSLTSFVLYQIAPGKSADSPCISKGIVQVSPTGKKEADPVWRTLEWHTRLELIHGARRPWLTGTHPTMLWNIQSKYAKYVKCAEYA
jgi:hypothetical protein